MELVKWDPRLVVDTGQLRDALHYLFEQPIEVKEGTSGISNSNWVYGEIPIKQTKNIFRFAVYLLPGNALVLFIQSGDPWLTVDWKQLLIGGLQCKLKRDGKVIPINFPWWSRKTDLGFGVGLVCVAWFSEEDFPEYKVFIKGLIKEYQNLWLKP
jgi:hypothetical protein